MRYLFISLSCLAAVVAGCEKSGPGPARDGQSKNTSEAVAVASPRVVESGELSPGAVDACALLTREEAEAVIGERVIDTQRSGKSEGGLDISQCYVAVATPANSVSLVVMQKAMSPAARDPRELWEETFEREPHGEGEEQEERKKPERIEGLGDAAFWVANPIGSALYVLKGNTYVRISVGGAADQPAKLEKSKAIAQLMLKRL